jgi:hypothetical protein
VGCYLAYPELGEELLYDLTEADRTEFINTLERSDAYDVATDGAFVVLEYPEERTKVKHHTYK